MNNYKKDFPIFKNNPELIYLDSAATSQKPQIVIDTITDFYAQYNSNIHRGLYPIAEKASAKVEEVREQVRKFINARDKNEIIFTHGATEGLNLIAYTWGDQRIHSEDTVVVTIMDHHANFVPWQQLAKKKKANFAVVSVEENGELDEKDLLQKVKNARLLALPYVSNVLGSINNLEKLIFKIRKINSQIIIVADAAQAAPFIPINVQTMDCDFFVFSGHKMYAGTGIGVLFGKKELLESIPPFLFGGDMIREVTIKKTTFADSPSKFEAGTLHIAGIISLGEAIDFLQGIGMEKVREQEQLLAAFCWEELSKIDSIRILGPNKKSERSNIVSFIMEGVHPHDVAQVLADNTICVRAGHHCAMPLHTFLKIPATVRVSFGVYNDQKDVEKLIQGIQQTKKLLQKK
ncbi:MAG TPA: SufS family cysteine desulfurase [Patescibacteria group bacterium]|nr:SufS family cysteine desulfurase [Patescibacteria group bacterium]